MKKRILSLMFLCLSIFIYAQAPIDVFDPIYDDISLWERTGLINDAPSIRPYPLQEIKRILDIVIEKGTNNQIKKAQQYKSRLFGRIFHFGGMIEFNIKAPKKQQDIAIAPLFELNLSLTDLLTASAHVNSSIINHLPKDEAKPLFQFSTKDIIKDSSKIGSFSILPMFNSGIAIGTPEYYFTAGMARTSFGPFDENNILIGEHASHAGQFAFILNKKKITYNQIFLALSASDDAKTELFPQKFLAGHSITYRPLPWISVGVIDLITYGGRFEPIYFLPLSAFFVGQSIYDFPDNSLLGMTFGIKPINGLRLDMVLLADDLGFNEIIKFKEAKWRMAGQFGISYAMPKDHWFTFADINYTFITPYCYTHFGDSRLEKYPNYNNYAHNGDPLGSNLPPNSDRLRIKTQFRPIEGLQINIHNTFIRHANITESITDLHMLHGYLIKQHITDGSVFNHSAITTNNGAYTYAANHAFLYSTPFLKQDTIQYINQAGIDTIFNLPILKSGGTMQLKLGYMFEVNINPGVNRNIYNYDGGIAALASKSFSKLTDLELQMIQSKANAQLSEWKATATGKTFSHYFNIAVKISY